MNSTLPPAFGGVFVYKMFALISGTLCCQGKMCVEGVTDIDSGTAGKAML